MFRDSCEGCPFKEREHYCDLCGTLHESEQVLRAILSKKEAAVLERLLYCGDRLLKLEYERGYAIGLLDCVELQRLFLKSADRRRDTILGCCDGAAPPNKAR